MPQIDLVGRLTCLRPCRPVVGLWASFKEAAALLPAVALTLRGTSTSGRLPSDRLGETSHTHASWADLRRPNFTVDATANVVDIDVVGSTPKCLRES